jgi:predicted nucleic acid-binding Zn ribbon protein
VHKVFYPAGIIFKGSGWYITDSRKTTPGTVPSEGKPSAAESKTDTSAETKTETKTGTA